MSIKVPILWINCDKHIDRKKKMEDMFQKYQLKNKRINGTYITNFNQILEHAILPTKKSLKDLSILTPSTFGCTLSHLNTAKYIVDNNIDSAIILEDDADVSLIFDNQMKFNKILGKIPDAEMLLLWLTPRTDRPYYYDKEIYKNGPATYKLAEYWGTVGYWIKNSTAQKLVDKYFNRDINKWDFSDYDGTYLVADYIIYSESISQTYIFPCLQTIGQSTIRNFIDPKIKDINLRVHNLINSIAEEYQ